MRHIEQELGHRATAFEYQDLALPLIDLSDFGVVCFSPARRGAIEGVDGGVGWDVVVGRLGGVDAFALFGCAEVLFFFV